MNDRPAPGAPRETRPRPRLRWLLLPLGAAGLVVTTQWWSAVSEAEQQVAAPKLGNTLEARLNPTPHVPVPATLEAMWYARDERTLPASSDLAGLARGIKMLDESGDAAAVLPLVSAPGLAKTDVAELRALLQRDCAAAPESDRRGGCGVCVGGEPARAVGAAGGRGVSPGRDSRGRERLRRRRCDLRALLQRSTAAPADRSRQAGG